MVYMGLTGGLYCVSVGAWCCVGVVVAEATFFYGDFEI